MNETLSNQPERERTETQAKQFEAERIANVVGLLWEAFHKQIDGQDAADGAIDEITRICISLAERDPELGAYLVEALESHTEASMEATPAEQVRMILGMPVPDYEAGNQPKR
jgi:malate synthase